MRMHTFKNIIVTGSVEYDQLMNFPKKFMEFIQPDKLHQLNVSFIVDHLEKQLGGTATNIAYNTTLLTDQPVSLLAGLGKDNQQFMDFFKENGIKTQHIVLDEELYTATGTGITDMQNNQIWGFYYGAGQLAKNIDLTQVANEQSLLIISANHIDSVLHFQQAAIQNSVTYIYDPGMVMTALSADHLREGVLNSTWFIGNDYEIVQITRMIGMSVEELIEKGVCVITTLGEKGVWYQSKAEKYHVEAYRDKPVVDPTGAGDAWRGGFLAAFIEGKSTVECLQQANALASFAVEKYGTVNHRPARAEVSARAAKLLISNSYSL